MYPKAKWPEMLKIKFDHKEHSNNKCRLDYYSKYCLLYVKTMVVDMQKTYLEFGVCNVCFCEKIN